MAAKKTTKRTARPAPRREREPARERSRSDREEREDRRGPDRDRGDRGKGKSDSNLTRLGGAWKRETKKGDPMLAGRINSGDLADYLDTHGFKGEDQVPILLLKNNYKESQKHPDFIIYGLDPEDVARRSRGRGNGGGRSYSRGRDRDDDRGRGRDDDRGGDRERGGGGRDNDLSLD